MCVRASRPASRGGRNRSRGGRKRCEITRLKKWPRGHFLAKTANNGGFDLEMALFVAQSVDRGSPGRTPGLKSDRGARKQG